MSYHGDIRLGDTIDVKFTTRRFSTGAPFTLAGTPAVSAYVGNGTTEITAGITLTVDFDSRTGLNNVRVVATSGNGFAAGTNVQLVITAGTVDSVSVVGEVIGAFSIEARSALMPTTAGRTADVDANGGVEVGSFQANAINAAAISDGAITAAKIATGAIDADAIAADAVTEIQAGLSTLDAAGVRAAVGLASANLDTQLSTIDDFLDTEVAAIKAKTDSLTFTAAGKVDANIQMVKGATVTGDGSDADPWGP